MSAALFNQHAKHVRRIILSSLACLSLLYFSTLSQQSHDCRKRNIIEHKIIALSETFLILRRIQPDIIMKVRRASCKVAVILFIIE
jgi:hypothetical protein